MNIYNCNPAKCINCFNRIRCPQSDLRFVRNTNAPYKPHNPSVEYLQAQNKALQERNEHLLETIVQLEQKIKKLEAGKNEQVKAMTDTRINGKDIPEDELLAWKFRK